MLWTLSCSTDRTDTSKIIDYTISGLIRHLNIFTWVFSFFHMFWIPSNLQKNDKCFNKNFIFLKFVNICIWNTTCIFCGCVTSCKRIAYVLVSLFCFGLTSPKEPWFIQHASRLTLSPWEMAFTWSYEQLAHYAESIYLITAACCLPSCFVETINKLPSTTLKLFYIKYWATFHACHNNQSHCNSI